MTVNVPTDTEKPGTGDTARANPDTQGTTQVEITFQGGGNCVSAKHAVHVFDLQKADILLGNDFLTEYVDNISYVDRVVQLRPTSQGICEVPFEVVLKPSDVKASVFHVLHATHTVKVPPWTQKVITCDVDIHAPHMYAGNACTPKEPGLCFMTFVDTHQEAAAAGLMVGKGVTDVYNGQTKLLVCNFSHKQCVLREGSPVAVGEAHAAGDIVMTTSDGEVSERMSRPVEWVDGIPPELDLSSARKVLSNKQFDKLKGLLKSLQKVWRQPGEQLGADPKFSHTIELSAERPINQKPRRLDPLKTTEARKEVDRMLSMNVIEPTRSPWAAPIVLVTKKDGSTRFCVDYRKLNEVTIADAYPLPRCDDLLSSLHGKKYFSALDLESGYWQIPMSVADKEKTAFVTPFGAWQFKVMPFGLRNAPATFQRTMDAVMAGAKWVHCLVYIDDVLIFSNSFDEHLEHIKDVFKRLVSHNFKLKPSKCEILRPEILYVGHLVSSRGILPNPAKVKAIKDWPAPKSTKEVESFLGLTGYFRKFIKDYAVIAKPLYDMKKEFVWGEEQQKAFEYLRRALINPPLLAHPDPEKPFVLETDACLTGLGAVLLQEDADGKLRPIEYASRLVRKHEANWAVRELEALGILWACENFQHWLLHRPFVIRSDHHSLKWMNEVQGGRIERWVVRLAPFRFTVVPKKGILNVAPDRLSRSGVDANPEKVSSEDILDEMTLFTTSEVTRDLVIAEQRKDKELQRMVKFLKTGEINFNSRTKQQRFKAEAVGYELVNRLLRKEGSVVLPQSLRSTVIKEYHDGPLGAHLSAEKLVPIIRKAFWWKNLAKDVREYCRACIGCARATDYASKRFGFLKPIQAGRPWHTVAMDLAGPFPAGYDDERYVLVMMDHFTKYVILIALSNKRAATIARKVDKHLIHKESCPKRVLTDDGSEFKGDFSTLLEKYHVQHDHTLPYHQQGNGMVERYMRLLTKMVRIVAYEDTQTWPKRLSVVAFAYNISYHPAVQNTPFFLNKFREPRLPWTNLLEGEDDCVPATALQDWIKNSFKLRAELLSWTTACIHEAQIRMETDYNEHQRSFPGRENDVCFVRREGIIPKSSFKWSELHRIVERDADGLNFKVQPVTCVKEPFWVNVQRLRPYTPSELNPQLTSVAPSRADSSPPPSLEEEEDDDTGDFVITTSEGRSGVDRGSRGTEPGLSLAGVGEAVTEVCTEAVGVQGTPSPVPTQDNRHRPVEVQEEEAPMALTRTGETAAQPEVVGVEMESSRATLSPQVARTEEPEAGDNGVELTQPLPVSESSGLVGPGQSIPTVDPEGISLRLLESQEESPQLQAVDQSSTPMPLEETAGTPPMTSLPEVSSSPRTPPASEDFRSAGPPEPGSPIANRPGYIGNIQGSDYFEVEAILGDRPLQYGNRTYSEYLIRWRDYDANHDSWVPGWCISHHTIKGYEQQRRADRVQERAREVAQREERHRVRRARGSVDLSSLDGLEESTPRPARPRGRSKAKPRAKPKPKTTTARGRPRGSRGAGRG